jgi:hypothetical protein
MGKNDCLQTSRNYFRGAGKSSQRIKYSSFLLRICELLSCLPICIGTPGYLLNFAINVLFVFKYKDLNAGLFMSEHNCSHHLHI